MDVTSVDRENSIKCVLKINPVDLREMHAQFYDRLLIVLMPVKYQPDYIYLRHVKLLRVHLFTLIQFICFVIMWVIKSIKETSITFPVMVTIA